jgi:hypothetical protein
MNNGLFSGGHCLFSLVYVDLIKFSTHHSYYYRIRTFIKCSLLGFIQLESGFSPIRF